MADYGVYSKYFNIPIGIPVVDTEDISISIPDINHVAFYAKPDGKFYKKTSDGVETVIDSGGGSYLQFFSGLVDQGSTTIVELMDDLVNKEFSEVRVFYKHGIIVYTGIFTVLADATVVSKVETVQDGDPGNYSYEFNIDLGILRLEFTASTGEIGNGSLIVQISNFSKVV